MTLEAVKARNPQLWFSLQLKLGKIYLEQNSFKELEVILINLKNYCRIGGEDIADGQDIMGKQFGGSQNFDKDKSSQLLEYMTTQKRNR